jgi:hypothetical protein
MEPFCLALKRRFWDSPAHFEREYLRLLLNEIVVDGKEVMVRGQYNHLIGAITKKLTPSGVLSFGIGRLPGQTKPGTERNRSVSRVIICM